jgi:hypothetical protein
MSRRTVRTSTRSGYVAPGVMRDYLYLRVSQKEPFDILYFTPTFTITFNRADHSVTLHLHRFQ